MPDYDKYRLTREDRDILKEVETGKTINKGSLRKNINALRRRIKQLKRDRANFLALQRKGHKVTAFLSVNNRELNDAKRILAGFEFQLGKKN